MSDEYTVVDPDEIEPDQFPESGLNHRKLTEALGATEMRVNVIRLSPGDVTGYHRHERQEEVFVLLSGPGRARIGGDLVDVPKWGVVRVPSETPRQLLNDAEEGEAVWLMLGAPTVGTVEDYGEYVVVDEE
ncbi:hypothetical protein AArcSl_0460 [Halalkaliarchaeum desulfuricum]|uniref:Cupin type-2 domain-containing protein n=1 Tax=Halalkaliarchaeum desulfuricum TaxID=2055893 RepID=A0A343TG91_9EURY|nr:cupin domain-containing protein [Halalkaliarchaeum desulfuricum]AUX08113.1 hypothetical protein AArcSl_0460 [Halalkaliarchaeum desulfuricum]